MPTKPNKHLLKVWSIWALILLASILPAVAQEEVAPRDTYENNPLLKQPETPKEQLQAVILLNNLGRADLAKKYLVQLLESNPDDGVILDLRDEYGPGVFLKLSRIEALRPESQQLMEMMNQAFLKAAYDPVRINELIRDLSAGGSKTQLALTSITDMGAPVVPYLLKEFVVSGDDSTKNAILYAIVQIGKPAIPVLIGGVMSPSQSLQDASIIALGWMGDQSVVSYLWFPAFGPDVPAGRQVSAKRALKKIMGIKGGATVSHANLAAELNRLTQRHLSNEYPWDIDSSGEVGLWVFSPANEILEFQKFDPEVASMMVGSHFSGQALTMAPQDKETQATYLALALAREYQRVGWDQALPSGPGSVYDLALSSGPDVISDALRVSMENTNLYSTMACLQALAQVASQQQLLLSGSRKTSLLTALNYPSKEVQFAAAAAIMKIDPDRNYAGKERVVSILAQALNDTGRKQSVVIDPDETRGAQIGDRLEQQGFSTQHVRTGRQGFKLASERMDVDLIVIHITTFQWSISQTIANLRADSRTAAIPIVLYGDGGQEYKLMDLIDRTRLSVFIPQLIDPVLFSEKIKAFLGNIEGPKLSAELKRLQVETAAYWLSYIAASKRTEMYDLTSAETALTSGISDPKIAKNCLIALSSVPTKTSQDTLLSNAVSIQNSDELRTSAAFQLAYHIQRHGWLLDNNALSSLHAAHDNAQSPEVATSLAAVIGSLKPNAQLVGERLIRFDSGQ